MDLLGILQVSGSGLSAERTRIQTVSSNIANAQTTRTAEGTGPYRRKVPVFTAVEAGDAFGGVLGARLSQPMVTDIVEDQRLGDTVLDPSHPDADENGYVEMPNVEVVTEMVDMISASRAYEANVTAISATKNMALKALEIGK
jgi:flagellar basal-body rod protein FlgC